MSHQGHVWEEAEGGRMRRTGPPTSCSRLVLADSACRWNPPFGLVPDLSRSGRGRRLSGIAAQTENMVSYLGAITSAVHKFFLVVF